MATQNARKNAVNAIEKALKDAVSRVGKVIQNSDKAYLTLAKELQKLNRTVCRKDPEANPKLMSLLEASAQGIGEGIKALSKNAKCDDLDTQTEGDKLSASVEHFSNTLIRFGESINSQCDFTEEHTAQINQFRDQLGKTAHEYHLIADNLTLAVGDAFISHPATYPLLAPSQGCCATGAKEVLIEAIVEGDQPVLAQFDETALEAQIELLGELLRRLLEILLLLAMIFAALPAISLCFNGCTAPFTWMPSLVGTNPANVRGGVRPSFVIQWDYCCQNVCFIWWTDEFVTTVATITYVKGPVLVNNIAGRTRAVNLATRFGNTLIANVGAGLALPLRGCAPPATYPAAPTC